MTDQPDFNIDPHIEKSDVASLLATLADAETPEELDRAVQRLKRNILLGTGPAAAAALPARQLRYMASVEIAFRNLPTAYHGLQTDPPHALHPQDLDDLANWSCRLKSPEQMAAALAIFQSLEESVVTTRSGEQADTFDTLADEIEAELDAEGALETLRALFHQERERANQALAAIEALRKALVEDNPA